jgi:hypothetical protein
VCEYSKSFLFFFRSSSFHVAEAGAFAPPGTSGEGRRGRCVVTLAPSLPRVFPGTRASSGVKCSKSREYAVPAAVRCTARLDLSDPCFRVLLNRFIASLRADDPEWCSVQRGLGGEATLAQWLQGYNLKADPAATRCRHFDELYAQEYPRRRGRLGVDIG